MCVTCKRANCSYETFYTTNTNLIIASSLCDTFSFPDVTGISPLIHFSLCLQPSSRRCAVGQRRAARGPARRRGVEMPERERQLGEDGHARGGNQRKLEVNTRLRGRLRVRIGVRINVRFRAQFVRKANMDLSLYLTPITMVCTHFVENKSKINLRNPFGSIRTQNRT
jgi:hypothetical protein